LQLVKGVFLQTLDILSNYNIAIATQILEIFYHVSFVQIPPPLEHNGLKLIEQLVAE
jgi:hypothetical protein